MPATASFRPVDDSADSVYPRRECGHACAKPQAKRSLLMTRQIHRIAALATAGLLAAGLAACSSGGSTGNAGGGAKPVTGGTLKIVAGGGPTYLDTVPAYYTANYILERTYA